MSENSVETRGCEFALSGSVGERRERVESLWLTKALKAIDEKENHFHVSYENELPLPG